MKNNKRPTYNSGGTYKAWENGKNTWMYDKHARIGYRLANISTYSDCNICPDLADYQDFAAHADTVYVPKNSEIDKDGLFPEAREYSKATITFLSNRINMALQLSKAIEFSPRSKNFPYRGKVSIHGTQVGICQRTSNLSRLSQLIIKREYITHLIDYEVAYENYHVTGNSKYLATWTARMEYIKASQIQYYNNLIADVKLLLKSEDICVEHKEEFKGRHGKAMANVKVMMEKWLVDNPICG